MKDKNILVTGGAGFIGSQLVRSLINNTSHKVFSFDNLSYAGNESSCNEVSGSSRYKFIKADLCHRESIEKVFEDNKIELVFNLAAETHVDRSIENPEIFIETNVLGTLNILEVARCKWLTNEQKNNNFKFIHVSTDEVYGDLKNKNEYFTETSRYLPNSPYSASKASSDHLVRSWNRTYGLPTIITNCSNNYGPYQYPEKLVPLTILKAINNEEIPIYGDGMQIRDWLYVEDHADALIEIAAKGTIGETYVIGGNNEITNLDLVYQICEILEKQGVKKQNANSKFKNLIKFVEDRPGHDIRYAIDSSKLKNQIGWSPKYNFSSGLVKTVLWYLENQWWWNPLQKRTHLEELG